jgi:hypothetical protein
MIQKLDDLKGRAVLVGGRAGWVRSSTDAELEVAFSGGTATPDVVVRVPRESEGWRLRYPSAAQTRPGAGMSSVWVAAKPGEARRYASPVGYSKEFAAVLLGHGYEIFRVDYELPDGWDSAGYAVVGKPVRGG